MYIFKFGYIWCSIYRIPLGNLSINLIDFLVLCGSTTLVCSDRGHFFIVLEIFDAGFEDAAHVGVYDPLLNFLIDISLREIKSLCLESRKTYSAS